ncbi:hypothetical protein Tco_1488864 [Tanacetum coccineum]
MNKKSYSFDMDTFRNMLQMCPKLPGQQFVYPPFEEDILTFMRELATLATSNYFLMSKLIRYLSLGEHLEPSSTSVSETVDYVYLLWEDLVFQIENKENKVDWHMANDDSILTTMRFILQHEVVQQYGAILSDNLTTQAMKESEAYKTYYAFATGKAIPKPKYVRRSTKEKPEQAPEATSGKRLKDTAKVTKSGKKKQPAKGLETLSEIAFGSGAHEGTGVTPGVPDVPKYGPDDEKLSWKSSDEDDDDDDEANVGKYKDDDDHDNDDEWTESDNDGEDFVHPKFSTHDDEARQEEVNEEDSFDPRVQTPSHVESTDDDNNDDEIQSANVAREEMDEEETNA